MRSQYQLVTVWLSFLQELIISSTSASYHMCLFPEGQWGEGPGKTIASSIMTALRLPEFKTAVRKKVKYEGVDNDHDQVISIMNRLKTEWQVIEKYEADRKEASRKVTGKRDARRGDKHQIMQGPAMAAASKPIAKVPVEECWHCEDLYLNIYYPQLCGSKQQGGSGGGQA